MIVAWISTIATFRDRGKFSCFHGAGEVNNGEKGKKRGIKQENTQGACILTALSMTSSGLDDFMTSRGHRTSPLFVALLRGVTG